MNTQIEIPTQHTLKEVFAADLEYAVCASMLFTIIVQDRYDIGGGYGVQVTALGQIHTEHFEDIEQVEAYLDANTPYTAHTPVWVPLPVYNSHKHETELLKKLWQ